VTGISLDCQRARHPVLAAAGLASGPMAVIGLARFAYALAVSAMRLEMHWSYVMVGALNSANAVGYLAGALVFGALERRVEDRPLFLTSLAATAASLVVFAFAKHFPVLLVIRTITGIASAVCFIAGASIATRFGAARSPREGGLLLGIYFGGTGAGIVLSGIGMPVFAASDWRALWLSAGITGGLALLVSIVATQAIPPQAPSLARRETSSWPARTFTRLLIAYGLFGAGYIAYMTFIVAYIESTKLSTGVTMSFWIVLGAVSLVGAPMWGCLLGRSPNGRGVAFLLAVASLGALLPVVSTARAALFTSAVLFGGPFFAVITAVTATVRYQLAPEYWSTAIAGLTIAFALGQSVGPVLAGSLADGSAGIRPGLAIGAVLLACAVPFALAQRSVRQLGRLGRT
jgi:predicted MFS family arabinose efflux permease